MSIKINLKKFIVPALFLTGIITPHFPAVAEDCKDLKIIFVRGSGESYQTSESYTAWRDTISAKLATTSLTYDFIDLDYPAVPVGLDHFTTSLGALVSGGDSYEFGDSVNNGSTKLISLVNHEPCKNTKFILGGYSQGAMVVSKSLPILNSDRIIYAATFGDPKIYLPEGYGLFPDACKNQNLSNYRMYVPDCFAYKGLLGSYEPYQPTAYLDKLGTWCNKADIFCSSHFNADNHTAYVSDQLYEDASRVIFAKISNYFHLETRTISPHDTAILIDSTGSMSDLIDSYKKEALRLAAETLESGGRVALYDYRDLKDPYEPVEHCNFDTCTLDSFTAGLAEITTENGGDAPESLLSASLHIMKKLNWRYGATKSVVVLTDAGYHNPDLDGTTFDDVVSLSHSIDPVNFYIITDGYTDSTSLATATDGLAITDPANFSPSTDRIMERYDSLPRVELPELSSPATPRPTLEITNYSTADNSVTLNFESSTGRTLVALNDTILGLTDQKSLTIDGLNFNVENTITLTPISDEMRGEPNSITIPATTPVFTPKTPNTGIFSL